MQNDLRTTSIVCTNNNTAVPSENDLPTFSLTEG